MESIEAVDTKHKELYEFIKNQSEDDVTFLSEALKTDGLTIRVGGKLLKFELSTEETIPIDDLKIEYRKQYIAKLTEIRNYLEQNLIESYQSIDVYKKEAEDKKQKYERLLKESHPVPELSYNDIKKGLSVCKSDDNGLIWLYKGIYAPKYLTDGNKMFYISPKHFKELITPINIQIRTRNDKITSLVILDIFGNKFKHYHDTGNEDCWGEWNYTSEKASTPDEIISASIKAIKILDTVNNNSPGNTSPTNLIRLSTLKNGVVDEYRKEEYLPKQSSIYKRLGLTDVDYDVMEIKRHTSNNGWTV